MVNRSKGLRSKTRNKLRKKPGERGPPPISRVIQRFDVGQKAHIVIDPGVQKGQPHPRFHGLTGEILGNQGEAYLVGVKVGGKHKSLVIRPQHLRQVKAE